MAADDDLLLERVADFSWNGLEWIIMIMDSLPSRPCGSETGKLLSVAGVHAVEYMSIREHHTQIEYMTRYHTC